VSPRRPEPHPHYRLSWTAPDRNDVVALAAEQSADVAAAALAAATDVEFGRRPRVPGRGRYQEQDGESDRSWRPALSRPPLTRKPPR